MIKGVFHLSEKLITCKKCGKDLTSSTLVCPSCGRRVRLPWAVRLLILAVIIGIVVYFVALRNGGSSSKPEENLPTISLAEFDSLKTGMSYQVTAAAIGSSGKVIKESGSEAEGNYQVTYQFEGEGDKDAYANITFLKNRLTDKEQSGLK